MTLQETQSPAGHRFFVDGQRVSSRAFRAVKDDAARLDSFVTRCSGDVVRQYCEAARAAESLNRGVR